MCAWIMIFLKVWEVFVTGGVFYGFCSSMGGFHGKLFLLKYGRFWLDMVCFKKYVRFSWQMISIKLWEVSVW